MLLPDAVEQDSGNPGFKVARFSQLFDAEHSSRHAFLHGVERIRFIFYI